MESIADTEWDILIAGTGLPQSLLALALSRSDKKILHVDANEYYGGADAALSLQDAEEWVKQVRDGSGPVSPIFSDARISQPGKEGSGQDEESSAENRPKLGYSRAYNLALSPQIVYMKSAFLSVLVSSKVFRQLEFMAVGNWFVYNMEETERGQDPVGTRLLKIPNSREDVFKDKSMGMKAKRSLISFQRLFRDPAEQTQALEEHGKRTLKDYLTEQYSLPDSLQEAVNALTLSPDPPSRTLVEFALPRIARHVTSMGASGPGFGAVIPKWGGLAEIAQVACRAQAVGGGVYMLGKGVQTIRPASGNGNLSDVTLSDDMIVKARLVAGTTADLKTTAESSAVGASHSARSISIVSFGFEDLFSRLAEDGPRPAVAVVSFPPGSLKAGEECSQTPVYLMVHSSESGECPKDQCVIYASIKDETNTSASHEYLSQAINNLLNIFNQSIDKVLWTLSYKRREPKIEDTGSANVLEMRDMGSDLSFDDSVLQVVRDIWKKAGGGSSDFMTFSDREVGAYDDEYHDEEDQ